MRVAAFYIPIAGWCLLSGVVPDSPRQVQPRQHHRGASPARGLEVDPAALQDAGTVHCRRIGWTRIPSLASTNTRYRSALSRGLVFFPFVCSILRADRRTFGIVVSKLGLQARGITSAPISPGSCYQVQ